MNNEVYIAISAVTTAVAGIVTTLVKNSRDINRLKQYACFRNPCPDRLTLDALQSKSSVRGVSKYGQDIELPKT